MSEQKRTRQEAFDVAGLVLDIAQDLRSETIFCNPERLKRRYRWFANKTLLAEMVERQRRIEGYCEQVYELYNAVSEWANEYPLEREQVSKSYTGSDMDKAYKQGCIDGEYAKEESIIALLESQDCESNCTMGEDCSFRLARNHFIALIKKETE